MLALSTKFLIVLLAVGALAKKVQIRNMSGSSLRVSVTGQKDFTLLPEESLEVSLALNWQGTITAHLDGCEICAEGPKTSAELSFGALTDVYHVSLIKGYNLPIKIIPINGIGKCDVVDCRLLMLAGLCPVEMQLKHPLGYVIGCEEAPYIFNKFCPKALISLDNLYGTESSKYFRCRSSGFLVLIG